MNRITVKKQEYLVANMSEMRVSVSMYMVEISELEGRGANVSLCMAGLLSIGVCMPVWCLCLGEAFVWICMYMGVLMIIIIT